MKTKTIFFINGPSNLICKLDADVRIGESPKCPHFQGGWLKPENVGRHHVPELLAADNF
jgi:hypothetical protein